MLELIPNLRVGKQSSRKSHGSGEEAGQTVCRYLGFFSQFPEMLSSVFGKNFVHLEKGSCLEELG